jgi:hypothetical protein
MFDEKRPAQALEIMSSGKDNITPEKTNAISE